MGFQQTIRNTAAGVSNPLMVEDYSPITVTVIPGMGSARAQYTTSSKQAISNGTATWIDWGLGQVNYPTSDGLMLRVVAIRLNSSADATLELVA